MDEYIEREALLDRANLILAALKKIEKSRSIGKINGARIAAIASLAGIMKETPAADVAPVVHGRWIDPEDDDGGTLWHCSKCGYPVKTIAKPNCNYCPKCGCKMREGNDGTK